MLWNNIELHNVARIEEREGATHIWRFPKSVQDMLDRDRFPTYSPGVGRMTTGCEMRFVAEGADVTDDNMLLERIGVPVRCVETLDENIKITTPTDLSYAEYVISKREGSYV